MKILYMITFLSPIWKPIPPQTEQETLNSLKQNIYKLEVLNMHIKEENEEIKTHNEILKAQNDTMLYRMCY